jgi:hypothetical protein
VTASQSRTHCRAISTTSSGEVVEGQGSHPP